MRYNVHMPYTKEKSKIKIEEPGKREMQEKSGIF
jgi:hypothetical protein